jgi:hypothetical protein
MKAQLAWIAVAAAALICGAPGATGQSSAGASEAGSAAATAGHTSASAMQAARVSAELTKRIDSKDAKVGEEVVAKTTSEARLADGTKIPKGSKLVGHVTEAEAKSKANHDGRVAFCFDHAVLKDGDEVPVNAVVRTIAAPAPLQAPSDADGMMGGGGMPGGGGGAPRADAPGGGVGLAGNGPSAARGATNLPTGTVADAAGVVRNTTSGIDGSVDGAPGPNGALGTGVAGAAGSSMQVGNLAGVTFSTVNVAAGAGNGEASAAAGTSMATMLTGHNRNASLDGGSQMTLAVAPR